MNQRSASYVQYPTCSETDERWGMYVTTCGYSKVAAGMPYPPRKHPSSYEFTWDKGRILNDHQVIYITRGSGIFESSSAGKKKITAGCIILIFPGEWHRYRPDQATGWDEYWVGIKGSMADQVVRNNFFTKEKPVLDIGIHERIIEKFHRIFETAESGTAAFQQILSGEAFAIMGNVYSLSQYRQYENTDTEKIVKEARILFAESVTDTVSPEDIARRLNTGYSNFRKIFKRFTGLAPGQYQLQLRIQKAREMIASTNKTIKEISYLLGFESNFYFSKHFKKKTGLTPNQYRQMVQKGQNRQG